jgi:hypothetical protein
VLWVEGMTIGMIKLILFPSSLLSHSSPDPLLSFLPLLPPSHSLIVLLRIPFFLLLRGVVAISSTRQPNILWDLLGDQAIAQSTNAKIDSKFIYQSDKN